VSRWCHCEVVGWRVPGSGAREAATVSSGTTDPWVLRLAELLASSRSEPERDALDFAERVSAGYTSLTSPDVAALDIREISALVGDSSEEGPADAADRPADAADRPADAADRPADAGDGSFGGRHRLLVLESDSDTSAFRLRRYGLHRIALTRFLPVLESFGLLVGEAIPYSVEPGHDGAPLVYIDDIGVSTEAPWGPEALRFVPSVHGPRLVEALEALARGETDLDDLNRLVTLAALDWHQVAVLRAYVRYRLQIGGTGVTPTRGWRDLSQPLYRYPEVARALVGYFLARFDPDADPRGADSQPERNEKPGTLDRTLCVAQLDAVEGLADDRILRGFLNLIDSTVRTNYFQSAGSEPGAPVPGGWPKLAPSERAALAIKFDSRLIAEMSAPKPSVEVFVHSPRVEGIHLRAGPIARGGLRWSERPDDFRTEVLDLAFAQVKKNAIIVPTGAKGGFVCRQGDAGPDARPSLHVGQVQAAYREFVGALLSVTDNILNEDVVAPPRVVAPDGPDPYLVVAADKGTATFSDVANSISESIGFWLGDAFASGGSRGYDHKAMGITARGAWTAVRRHFRELAVDVQADPVRVVGVGDMSGDVFGNGMLQSRSILLVAAFDHRHIFVDPDPDPEVSFNERERLAALSSSSWADYRSEAISPGGGVWPRSVKSIPLTSEVRRALGISRESMSPPELVAEILAAPVDLLWFGGIGTYVKAPDESDSAVGDGANDGVRITSDQVRARVVAEGANLGVTQKARIRFSRRGGRINADFIDNAAGVATSDREVNIKILLGLAIETGALDPTRRDDYLQLCETEVAEQVLSQVDHSVLALNRAAIPAGSAREIDAYEALIDDLESTGLLNREVEVLPSREEIQVRREAEAGLIRPELAVLLSYAKSALVEAIEETPTASDPGLLDSVVAYFPAPVRDAFPDLVPRHRLYRQLAATDVAGELVDRLGVVWAHETAVETGRALDDVASAFWVARRVTRAGEMWEDLDSRSWSISFEAETAMHSILASAVQSLARSYLVRPTTVEIGPTIDADWHLADDLAQRGLEPVGSGNDVQREVEGLLALGVDEKVAGAFVSCRLRSGIGEIGPVARRSGRPVDEVVQAFDSLEFAAGFRPIAALISGALSASPPPGRLRVWLARALRDDLSGWSRQAATSALEAEPTADGRGAAAIWVASKADSLSRVASLALSPQPQGADPLALASLCVRRLQAVLD
jgi:glutamate dehydrogenase